MAAEALVGGLASLGGSLLTGYMQRQAADEAYGRQQDLMRLQNQYAVQNWNRENDYNLPIHQKERLKQAGLNPDLMYGNGAAGLQAGSIDAPSSPSAPMAQVPDFSTAISDGANAALAIAQAKKADKEGTMLDIENSYRDKILAQTLDNMVATGDLTKEQIEQVKQAVKESQANIEVMRARVDNETYDRFLATLSTASNIALQDSQIGLNDEQKKWVGTHALAALIGARGTADQAHAMAAAIKLFRDPEQFSNLVDGYIKAIRKLVAEHFGDGKDGNGKVPGPLGDLIDGLEALANGDVVGGLFGPKGKKVIKKAFKRSPNTPPTPHNRR